MANISAHAQGSTAILNGELSSLRSPTGNGQPIFGQLTSVAGCFANGKAQFSTATRSINGSMQNYKVGMSQSEMQTFFDGQAGYHQTFIQGYYKNGEVKYNAIFEKSPAISWYAAHAIPDVTALNTMLAEAKSKGYRPRCLSGYQTGLATVGFAAIFEKYATNPAWQVEKSLTAGQYQEKFNYWTARGYRLEFASGYTLSGVDLYIALFVKEAGPAWYSYSGMSGANFKAEQDNATAKGYYLKCLSYYGAGGDTYLAIWEEAPKITLTGEIYWSSVPTSVTTCGLIFESENKFLGRLTKENGEFVSTHIQYGPIVSQGNIKKMTYKITNLISTYGYDYDLRNNGKYQTVNNGPKYSNFIIAKQRIYTGIVPADVSSIFLNNIFCPTGPN